MADNCCNEYSRSNLLRRAAAEAGSGLPQIEPGMPLPAGTGLDRRGFVVRSLGLALAVYGGGALRLPLVEEGIAEAAANAPPAAPVLVSVFLSGGADSLNILAPIGDPDYRKLRPTLALPDSGLMFPDDGRLRWHPSTVSFQKLHAEGKLAVVPAIGYRDADQSHFTSKHYWEVGNTSARLRTGWLGRYLDRVGSTTNPLQGLSLDGELAPSLATARKPVAALRGADAYSFWAPGVWGEVGDRMVDAIGSLGATRRRKDRALGGAGAIVTQADQLRRQLAPFRGGNLVSPVAYPSTRSGFPKRLAGLAAMLAAGLPIRVVALNAFGMYDTHSDQPTQFAEALKVTSESLLAFQRDLEARGLADRVVTLVWSEFGRRAEENGSDGTDHGAGGIGFLMGSRVRGGMIGQLPALNGGLDRHGNINANVDYRSIYCSLLEQWLGHDAAAVIPNAKAFQRFSLIR